MSPEAEIEAALKAFRQNTRPIFVFYGDVPYFPHLISQFRAKYQLHDEYDYLTVDLKSARRRSVAETLFEILRQIGRSFIEKTSSPEIGKCLKSLKKKLEEMQNLEPDEKFGEFVRFSEFLFFPVLKENTCNKHLLIEFNCFEHVTDYGANIRNFILERLVKLANSIQIKCLLFAKIPIQPNLNYGSNTDAPLSSIKFHQLHKTDHSETNGISQDYENYLKGIEDKPTVRKNEKGLNAASELTGENTLPQEDVTETLKRKRENDDYDVFLCHNNEDKDAVKKIGEELKQRGILPWLDEWDLIPGTSWQDEIENQIKKGKAVAVFLGPNGQGPWQSQEYKAFIRSYIRRKCPVIPVFLKDYEECTSEIPIFLEDFHFVDFRKESPNPIKQLISGIRGKKPEGSSGEIKETT